MRNEAVRRLSEEGCLIIRTCVGCQQAAPLKELLRFVISSEGGENRLTADPERRRSGRGAYCHLRMSCLSAKRLSEKLRYSLYKNKAGGAAKDDAGLRGLLEEANKELLAVENSNLPPKRRKTAGAIRTQLESVLREVRRSESAEPRVTKKPRIYL